MRSCEDFFEWKCYRCGVVDEIKLTIAGPHIKQVCNSCGSYVCFFLRSRVPPLQSIRQKTWEIADKDLPLITHAKKEIRFKEGLTGWDRTIQYYSLYLKIRDYAKRIQHTNQ